jgi:hypothetical protein
LVAKANSTGGRIQNFGLSAQRHGTLATLMRYLDSRLHRLLGHELCRVELSSIDLSNIPDSDLYETRAIDSEEFQAMLCSELEENRNDKAFARGDMCVASMINGEVVGFTFYTRQPTEVNDAIVFRLPESFTYSYGSMTAPSHRGRKLERIRWKAAQMERIANGSDTPIVAYVNVMNLESRAAQRRSANTELLGYTGYWRIAGRWFCFRSPGCRRMGVGFWHQP